MFLLNMSLAQFLALSAAVSAAVVALYLLDRSRRLQVVATLRFWKAVQEAMPAHRRWRIQQPWSLLLQLLGTLLLLAALAGLRWGSPGRAPRDHVILLDTSAWMAARGPRSPLLDEAKAAAIAYLGSVRASDRVMIVRAGATVTPVTRFESDRAVLEQAIRRSRAGRTSLKLNEAVRFARRAQRLAGGSPGEIVYVGAGHVDTEDAGAQPDPDRLRVLPVNEPATNCGLRRLGMRRSANDPALWEIFATARNYGRTQCDAPLTLEFGHALIGVHRFVLDPGQEQSATFRYRTRSAGWIEARLRVNDALAEDNRAQLEVPAAPAVRVLVYSERPDLLRPVLGANPNVDAVFANTRDYQPKAEARVVILDRFRPVVLPEADTIWIEPPADASLFKVHAIEKGVRLERWHDENPLGAGLHTQDLRLDAAQVFSPESGDLAVADCASGPLILARPGAHKAVALGFHPGSAATRFELATPLLFANILRWMAPDVFQGWEVNKGGEGTIFTLALPDVADAKWEPPKGTLRGLLSDGAPVPLARDLWQALAVAGALAWLTEWVRFGRRRTKTSMALKLAMLLSVFLALVQPRLHVLERRMAVTVLADTSTSLSERDLEHASQLASTIDKGRGRNWVRVLPFAGETRLMSSAKLSYAAGEAGRVTDIEQALREALAALPAGLVPRVALISDGKENHGSAARGAALMRQLGVPVDTFDLTGRPKPGLSIEAASIPAVAFTGEKFTIDLDVRSPRRAAGVVEIAAEGKSIGSSPVALSPGVNPLRVHAAISEPGAISVTGTVRVEGLEETHFSQAVALRRPRLLYISGDPPGWEEHLLGTLRAAQFDIDTARDALTPQLDNYQLAVFNNWDLDSLPAARKTAIEDYVKQGGGLLVIGGERNIYREHKPAEEDPVERALPARLAPPRSPEGRCVVLVIDKSSSMQGRKMELSRLAATGVIENLRPIDMLGLLVFDTTFRWVVPIGRVEDPAPLKRLVSGIEADGGTQLTLALAEAYEKILPAKATFKHILLLTDGISEPGDSIHMSQQAGQQHVTISTVGIGQDVNRPYLEQIASLSNGRSYFLMDPSGLEQIVLRDVLEHTGSTAVEEAVKPAILRTVELLGGVGMDSAPPLGGYVRFVPKPDAETILQVGDKDPLLARWQYGLGRSIVFASDAKSRWAERWVSWKGFDRFWTNVARDLLPHAQASEANVTYDRANGELVVDYRFGQRVEEPRVVPDIFAFGPGGFERPVEIRKVAGGAYRGRVAVGDRQGLFRVRPLAESRAFPEVGLDRTVDEMREYGNNVPLLRRVAESTGGRFNPQPRQVFDSGGRGIPSTVRLWPGLLALAVVLNLTELVIRKWWGRRFRLP